MKELKRILHAEDEPDIQAIVRLALERVGGFTVLSCQNGRVALDAMAEFRPDLLLLDGMMPEMDGPTLLKKLRAGGPFVDTPAIFLTAKVQAHEVEQYLAIGACAVLAKPFEPMQLAAQIREIWAKRAPLLLMPVQNKI